MLPDPYKAFFLETDASLVATGEVLYQINQEGEYQPCSFISYNSTLILLTAMQAAANTIQNVRIFRSFEGCS